MEPWSNSDNVCCRGVLLAHACTKQFNHLAIKIEVLMILKKPWIHLFTNTTSVKSAGTAPVLFTPVSPSDCPVTALEKTVRHLQCVSISPQAVETNHIEENCVPIHIIEHWKWWRSYNSSVSGPIKTRLFFRKSGHVMIIGRPQQYILRYWSLEDALDVNWVRNSWSRLHKMVKARDSWQKLVSGTTDRPLLLQQWSPSDLKYGTVPSFRIIKRRAMTINTPKKPKIRWINLVSSTQNKVAPLHEPIELWIGCLFSPAIYSLSSSSVSSPTLLPYCELMIDVFKLVSRSYGS